MQTIFDELFNLNDKLNFNQQPKYKSRIFLSHDIDTIYGSILQDSLFNIKKLRPDLVLKVMLFNLFSNPAWLNIDRIMKIESRRSRWREPLPRHTLARDGAGAYRCTEQLAALRMALPEVAM